MNITKVITDESQAPLGYIRICEMAAGNEDLAKQISKLHNAGAVPAVKLMRSIQDKTGPVWVCKNSVEHMLKNTPQNNTMPPVQFNSDASLKKICELMEKALMEVASIAQSVDRLEKHWSAKN